MPDIDRLLAFLAFSERLKTELRHSWLSDGRQESVAEHCWQMALMAMMLHRHLAAPVDLGRTLQMILVHDLVEAEAGDVPVFETGERKALKQAREQAAIAKIQSLLPDGTGDLFRELWEEFEAKATPEARFAAALDHLEVQIQHNLADLATWEPREMGLPFTKMDGPCAHDPVLRALAQAVKAQSAAKLRDGGHDVAVLVGPVPA